MQACQDHGRAALPYALPRTRALTEGASFNMAGGVVEREALITRRGKWRQCGRLVAFAARRPAAESLTAIADGAIRGVLVA